MYNFDNTLTEINGSVIYCDDMLTDPVLNHQAIDLAYIEDYEVSPLHCSDTIDNVIAGVDQAWQDGYEHIVVITDPSQVEVMEDELLDLFENRFESISVVGKKSSLKEQDGIIPTQPTQTQTQGQVTQGQVTQGQVSQNQGQIQQKQEPLVNKKDVLIFLRANPPLKGFGAILAECTKIIEKYPNSKIVLHNLGVSQYIIKGENKYDILFSGRLGSSLYGNLGTTSVEVPQMDSSLFEIIESSQDMTSALIPLIDPKTTVLMFPAGMEQQIRKLSPNSIAENFKPLEAPDIDSTGNHEKILLLGAKIAQESLATGKKRDELEQKVLSGDKEAIELAVKDAQESKKEELTAHDKSMMMLLSVFDKAFKKEALDVGKLSQWFKGIGMTKEFQDLADVLAKQSGVGLVIDGFKGLKNAMSGKKDTSGDGSKAITDMNNDKAQGQQEKEREKQQKEREKQQKEREEYNKITRESLGLDPEAVLKHQHYKEFKSFFDDPKN